jgi:hypothetical protein
VVVTATLLLMLGASATATWSPPVPAEAAPQIRPGAIHSCSGEMEPPLDVLINLPQGIGPGAAVHLSGSAVLLADAPLLTLRFSVEGPVSVNADPVSVGPVFAGEQVPFELPVLYGGRGKAAVHVLAEATDELGKPLFSRRETLYALLRPGRSFAGFGDFMSLQLREIRERAATEALSLGEVAAARKELVRMQAVRSGEPFVSRPVTDEARRLNTLAGAPPEGYVPAPESVMLSPGTITIQGNVQWQDENGILHPVFGATIQIWDEDTGFDEYITAVVTDVNGNYSATVDDDDGFGAGDRDIYVVYLTANGWVDCMTTGDDTYFHESSVYDETPAGTVITESFFFPAGGTNDSNSVFQAATWIAAYVAGDAQPGGFPQVDIVWPNGDTKSFYDGQVQIEQPDRYDWDTVHHEFGHYAAHQLVIEENPGGPHNIGDCITAVHSGNKSEGTLMAWAEGWPTYFALSGQTELNLASLSVPRVGDDSYQDIEDGSVVYSIEAQDNNGRGEDNELAVQRLLWDLYDANSDSRDNIARSDNLIWNSIKSAGVLPHNLSQYWLTLRSGMSNEIQLLMGEIASDHQIGPRLDSPIEGSLVTPSSMSFSWQPEVGCPTSYDGDSFDLVFYHASSYASLLTIPGLGTTSYTLSLGELQSLSTTTHDVLWAVEGRNSGSPATGPYLGESFAIVVNQPPIADAGLDQTAECTSPTTTPVTLDGTGSSDPDGDALTYMWTAPSVSFDDATSPTPTGGFWLGQTITATLTVSDGIQEDSDDTDVTVDDTTPPDITCPQDITVECSAYGGTPASDPALAPFFAGVSASDICDLSVDITNDAPAFFNLGTTVVTFTATDDFANFSTCQATVIVEDTIPPDILMSVSPDTLWPPNHKMWTITATVEVSDICDPSPDVFLTSIVSDEADDGLGDGHTKNDIQGATIGQDDREFRLRSERAAGGDGRIYTIVYTAEDDSGNTASDDDAVEVRHDRQGSAALSSGFTSEGTGIDPDARQAELVILSSTIFNALTTDVSSAYLGNDAGFLAPARSRVVDHGGDGLPDLVVGYDAGALRALSSDGNGGRRPVSLYYLSIDGTAWAVEDIFRLGPPLPAAE